MKIKDYLILVVCSLLIGYVFATMNRSSANVRVPDSSLIKLPTDTMVHDTVVDVKGKNVLFIGDSHSAFDFGWQHQVATKTGMRYLNTAVGGKQTQWMLETARMNMSSNYDYCFIYGGANDMAGNRAPIKSVKTIQRIVDLCKIYNVKAIVITGFDPITCVNITGRGQYKGYPERYAKFQQMLLDSIHGAKVIKTHCISRTDCGDFLCHMTASGHRKMAAKVISELKFKKVTK
jgi:hypothetical protein